MKSFSGILKTSAENFWKFLGKHVVKSVLEIRKLPLKAYTNGDFSEKISKNACKRV